MLDTLGAGPLGDFGDGAVLYTPGAHVAVTPLPTPPSRSDTTDFAIRADDFLGALPTFAVEVNGAVIDAIQQAAGIASSTSSTSLTIGTGEKTFIVATGENFVAGLPVVVSNTSSNWMFGLVNSYNSGTGELKVGVSHTSGSGTYASWRVTVSGTPVGAADVQDFVSPGATWTKPANRSFVMVEVLGGGGGGGGGQMAAVSSERLGGGGGGGGARVMRVFKSSELGATETITVGIGGAGGTGGGSGSAGGNASFGSHVTAYGGNPGHGPDVLKGAGGTGGGSVAAGRPWPYGWGPSAPDNIGGGGGSNVITNISSGCAEHGGGAGGSTFVSVTSPNTRLGGSSIYGGAGGGAGASYRDNNLHSYAGAGGVCGAYTTGGGGAAGSTADSGGETTSTAGAAGTLTAGNFAGSGGGGGGAAGYAANGTGSVGGAGARGAGGGGGGASTGASGSGGNGGAGGDGFCRVTSW